MWLRLGGVGGAGEVVGLQALARSYSLSAVVSKESEAGERQDPTCRLERSLWQPQAGWIRAVALKWSR